MQGPRVTGEKVDSVTTVAEIIVYGDERDTLLAHLCAHAHAVDEIVIVESDVTFQGLDRGSEAVQPARRRSWRRTLPSPHGWPATIARGAARPNPVPTP